MDTEQQQPKLNSSIVIFSVYCFLTVLHLIGGLYPSYFTWGISYWSLFPVGIQLFYFMLVLSCFMLLYKFRYKIDSLRVFDSESQMNYSTKVFAVFILSILLGFLFYWFRSKAHIYGDGFTILKYVSTTESIELKDQFYLQIGAVYLHHYAYILLSKISSLSSEEIFAATNALGGVVGFWAVYSISSILSETKKEKYFYLFLSLTSGTVLLFFGYIENYVWSTSMSLWTIFFALSYMKNNRSVVPMLVTALLAVFLHGITVPFLVFVIFVLLDSLQSTDIIRKVTLFYLAIFTLVMTFLIMLFTHIFEISIFVPFLATEVNNYSLFYPNHFSDWINLFLLLSPLGFCFIILGTLSKANIESTVYRSFSLLTLFLLLSSFVINPEIGMVRDFDLFACIGIPISIYGGYLLINKMHLRIQSWMVIGMVIILFGHVVPNVYEKNDLNRAVDHLDPVIWNDPHYQTDYEYAGRGLSWGFLLRKSVQRPDLAKKYFERNAASDTLSSTPLYNIALLFIDSKQYDSARYYLKQGFLTTPHDPKYFAKLAELEYFQNDLYLAEQYSIEALKIDSNFDNALTTMGIVLVAKGDENAYRYLSKAYQNDPIAYQNSLNLAIYFIRFMDVDSAYHYFSNAVEDTPHETKEKIYGSLISLALRKDMKENAYKHYQQLLEEFPQSELIPQKKKELGL